MENKRNKKPPKVILEPKIEPHHAALYTADVVAEGVDSLAAVGAEQIAAYDDQGFLFIRGAFDVEEVTAAKRELQRMVLSDNPDCDGVYYEGIIRDYRISLSSENDRTIDGSHVGDLALGQASDQLPALPQNLRAKFVRKFMGFTEKHPPLGALAEKPELLEIVTWIIGEPVRLFQDMAMIKPPRGREKPWHQDHAYFNLGLDTRIMGVWMPLHETTPANGCMYVLAGAHREGPQPHFMRRDWQICDTEIYGCQRTAVLMQPGDVLLFDAKLPHGTPTNHTNQQRWAVQFHYVPCSAVATDDEVRLAAFGSEGKNVTC
jgi:phytanoyl-CoA hydroxylase